MNGDIGCILEQRMLKQIFEDAYYYFFPFVLLVMQWIRRESFRLFKLIGILTHITFNIVICILSNEIYHFILKKEKKN